MKYSGTRYNSLWDASTLLLMLLVAACCSWVMFLGDNIGATIITAALLLSIVILLLGTYYRIDGDKLIIYQFFRPSAFPIDKIAEIKPTKSILSAPATSLTHHLAIKFSDRKVLRSSMPLIISPVRQKEFIDQLLSINPEIKTF